MTARKPAEERVERFNLSIPPELNEVLGELADDQAGGNKSLLVRRWIEAAALVAPRRLDQLAEEFAQKDRRQ